MSSHIQGKKRVAIAYKQGRLAASMNPGVVVSASIAPNPSSYEMINLGKNGATSVFLNGSLAVTKYAPIAVSDERLQELSKL